MLDTKAKMIEENTDKQDIEKVELLKEVFLRLKKYEGLNTLEEYAIFMGKAQILELGLKNLLCHRCEYKFDKIKRWTLGTVAKKLKESGLRADFIVLLKSVVDYRNYIAHEFLANDALIKSITGGESGRLELKHLEKGIIELEQIMLFYDLCIEHNTWD